MKKTFTVNLSGIVYHIDEDAYELLKDYLDNLRNLFKQTEGADEILQDIEARISELLNGKLASSSSVIGIDDVKLIIAQLGQPEDIKMADGEPVDSKPEADAAPKTESVNHQKRLFRDSLDKRLGGVCAGLAAYIGTDPTWVRLGAVILIFLQQWWILLAYLTLWVLIPEAKSATERLQMTGKPINFDTIGKTVSDKFTTTTAELKSGSLFHTLLDMVLRVAVWCAKLFYICLALCFLPVAFVLLVVFFTLLFVCMGFVAAIPSWISLPFVDWVAASGNLPLTVAVFVCGILSVGIPLYAFIVGLANIFHMNVHVSNGWKIFLFVLWIFALIVGTALIVSSPIFLIGGGHPLDTLYV